LVACDKDDDNNNNNQLNTTDRTFMLNASLSNSAEIDAANLAVTKSATPAITAFAQQMITEHTTAQSELKTLGTSVSYAVSDSIDSAHISIKQMLDTLSGRAFDSAYIYNQVTDHQSAVTNFQTEQSSGQNASVKSYANTYLPHIQAHLQAADSIATSLFPK
jgi:putative membrane protein